MNMNKLQQPWTIIILYLFFLYSISTVPQYSCQSNSPQNIQTFYPFGLPPIASTPNTSGNLPPSPSQSPTSALPLPSPPSKSSSSKKAVVKAVVATAASTLLLSGLFFFFLQRYTHRRRKNQVGATTVSTKINGNPSVLPHHHNDFVRVNGNLKGVIVDEEGLDVLYWRKLEGESDKETFDKEEFAEKEEEKKIISKGERGKKSKPPIQEIPLLRGKSSSSHVWPEAVDKKENKAVEKQDPSIRLSSRSPPPPPSPSPMISSSTPPPPMALAKRSPAPPPPPPKTGGLASSLKPPPAPKGMPSDNKEAASSSEQGMTGNEKSQVKMKPLHWDKVNPNAEHSMVWDKVHGGSFRFDDDLMEALFGSVATNRKSPRDSNMSSPKGEKSGPPSQIFILDIRKSQNIAIVLRSLAVSRKEIVDALIEGQGLDIDVLEKLTRIAPNKEEETEILAFDEDHTRLADAESFLYHVLKAVPSAFTRFNAMLFRINYDSEIIHIKESLQTLESGCKELRTRGLFLKLLEAVLKAGNRMNAGTSRGNAQAFNLNSLQKLSDVKSTDGKTTLLHFVVEEVVRAEGKRCLISRNHSLKHSSSRRISSNSGSLIIDNPKPKEDKENEYIMFGLPVVGGISAEFSNVKKAASLDYEALQKSCSSLTDRVAEIRQLVGECAISGGGQGFIREMKGFLDGAEGEIRVVREELTRIMELVKKTTDYYQAGASKDKWAQKLQLFVIVKDFLGMVDQVCVDITRNLQKRKTATAISGSSSPPATRTVKFPLLPPNFMSDKSKSSSSYSDDDF